MAHDLCRKRLLMELVDLKKNPVEHVQACPHEKNILEWHYVVEGPKESAYEGGVYHGILQFPKEYPYKPPAIFMLTRNGRFMANTRLCLSMSDFHPEQWNPIWSVSSILSGLLSFMLDTESTLGSIDTTDTQKRIFAAKSLDENIRDKNFTNLFPQYVELYKRRRTIREKKKVRNINVNNAKNNLQSPGTCDPPSQANCTTSGSNWRILVMANGIFSDPLRFSILILAIVFAAIAFFYRCNGSI